MNDPRDSVLAQLRTHAAKALDMHEAAMAADMIRFVEAHADCAERLLQIGHLTGSAWIVDRERKQTLLTHHHKLDKWLQLGGHADGELNPLAVALREAREESGLTRLRVVDTAIFDVDRHLIPARKTEPDHWHYDIRFMIEADSKEPFVVTDESHDLAWIEIVNMADYNAEESMLRMARKTLANACA
jgi:8-oxo-dGTP pyrophosphatase MutT (NUDIX family)